MWGTLNGFAIPKLLPSAAESLLRSLDWHRRKDRLRPEAWFSTLQDAPAEGPIRAEVSALADTVNRHAESVLRLRSRVL
jgi:acetoin utilization protein AcuC